MMAGDSRRTGVIPLLHRSAPPPRWRHGHRLPLRPSPSGAAWSPSGAPWHLLDLRPRPPSPSSAYTPGLLIPPVFPNTVVLWAAPTTVSASPVWSESLLRHLRDHTPAWTWDHLAIRFSPAREGGQGRAKDRVEGGARRSTRSGADGVPMEREVESVWSNS